MTHDAWNEVARGVGLTLAYVSDAHVTATTFHTLRREMAQGTSAHGPVDCTGPWLHGRRGDVSVIVRLLAMRQTGEAAKPTAPTHTTAIAEIDPPLFAGLRMFSRDLVAFFGAATGEEPSAHPALDRFLMYAFDAGRVREILRPNGLPDGLGESIAHASRSCSIVIRDSSVETIAIGATPDGGRVDGLVEIATSLARAISSRARTLRHTPLEVAARNKWQALAASLGLSIDPLRWHIFGTLGDVTVSVMLEGSPPAVSTTFRARLRTRLACALFLRRGYEKVIAMGYPEFDKLLVLQSPHPVQARVILADPELRQLLAAEAKTSNLVLDDCEIVLGRGGFAGTREISSRLEALVAIVDRLTPSAPKGGPFR